MASFTYNYVTTTPAGTAIANTLDTVIQTDKGAVNERYSLEHYAYNASGTGQDDDASSNAQGRHKPGYVSAVFVGTTAEIAALSGMTKGALAFDTTLSLLRVYDGTSWTTYGIPNGSAAGRLAFRAYVSSAQTVPASTTTKIVFDGESFDYGSKFDKDTEYRFTPGIAGVYQINAQVQLTGSTNSWSIVYIYVNGAQYTLGNKLYNTSDQGCVVSDLVYLDADDYVEIYAVSTYGGTTAVRTGATNSNFSGYQVATV